MQSVRFSQIRIQMGRALRACCCRCDFTCCELGTRQIGQGLGEFRIQCDGTQQHRYRIAEPARVLQQQPQQVEAIEVRRILPQNVSIESLCSIILTDLME